VPEGTRSTPHEPAARAIGAAFSERFWRCEEAGAGRADRYCPAGSQI